MNKHPFNQLMELLQKAGDKLVILAEGQPPCVLMKLTDYQTLIKRRARSWDGPVSQLTETELLDRINRDIAIWQASRESDSDEVGVSQADDELKFEPINEAMMPDFDDFGCDLDDESEEFDTFDKYGIKSTDDIPF